MSATPRTISPQTVERIKVMEECAECLLCVAHCPAFSRVEGYAGPMTFVKIAKLGFDDRDQIDRLAEAAEGKVFECVSCFRCEEVCPHEIPVRRMAIAVLRTALRRRRVPPPPGQLRQAAALAGALAPPQPRTLLETLTGTPGSWRHYETGLWAWLLNRITAWLVALYLIAHLWVIGFATLRKGAFDRTMEYFTHTGFLTLDLLLLGVLVFHGLNGVRLILVDYWPKANHKALFWAAVALTLVVMAASGPIFFGVL